MHPHRARRSILPALLSVLAVTGSSVAENGGSHPGAEERRSGEFTFVRGQYQSVGGFQEAYYFYDGRLWQRWETDFPEADRNLLRRLPELSAIVPDPRPLALELTDPRLFQFPFLYLSDVGWMELDSEQAEVLRTYLLKGGFLWIDDFWGEAEWQNLERNLERVLPGTEWRELGADHPLLRTVFPLDGPPQIPARDFAIVGWTHDPPEIHRWPARDLETPSLRAWFDDQGRMLALASYNTDTGDGWEREGYGEWYFETYSTLAYAMGVNVVVWALTR